MTSHPSKEQLLYEVIGRLYDAALDDALWDGIAIDVARVFDATSTSLHMRKPNEAPVLLDVTGNLIPTSKALREQGPYWRKRDPWVKRALEVYPGKIVTSADLFTDKDFKNTEFYQEWCRHLEIFYVIGALFRTEPGEIGGIGIHRPPGETPFSQDECQLAEILLHHFRKALNLRHQMQLKLRERDASLQAHAHNATGTLLVSQQRSIQYACPLAESLLSQADGLRQYAGKLEACSRHETALLQTHIDEALRYAFDAKETGWEGQKSSVGRAAAIRRAGRLPLVLLVAPFRPQRIYLQTSAPAALILVREPELMATDRLQLRELFGFTAAEAAVADLLTQGDSVEIIAEKLVISMNTVRTHVKNILVKTQSNRQAEAIALMLRSLAGMHR